MTGRPARNLFVDSRGASAVEFALIAPTLLMTVFGLFDLGFNMYTNQMLSGAIQRAARGATIEGASSNSASLDAIVTQGVHAVAPTATLSFDRKSYTTFSDVGRPEDYTDVNNDGTCDNGEPFEDANRNGIWDSDRGTSGFGGARDAVLYTVTVRYKRVIPIFKFIPGQSDTMTLQNQTVLRNQPFGQQNDSTPQTGNCA